MRTAVCSQGSGSALPRGHVGPISQPDALPEPQVAPPKPAAPASVPKKEDSIKEEEAAEALAKSFTEALSTGRHAVKNPTVPFTTQFQVRLWMTYVRNVRAQVPEVPEPDFVGDLSPFNTQFLDYILHGLLGKPCRVKAQPILADRHGFKDEFPSLMERRPLAQAVLKMYATETGLNVDSGAVEVDGISIKQMPTLYMSSFYESYHDAKVGAQLDVLRISTMTCADKVAAIDDLVETTSKQEYLKVLSIRKSFYSRSGAPLVDWLMEDCSRFDIVNMWEPKMAFMVAQPFADPFGLVA